MLAFSSLTTLRGWRRFGLVYLLGFVTALAFPPFSLLPVLWVSFPLLFLLVRAAPTGRQAFGDGWGFAFGLLTLSLYWTAGALFVDIAHFWWALPLAIFGLPSFLALYYGAAAALARRLMPTGGRGPFFFALCFFFAELARGHLLTGFPWDILGYVWSPFLSPLQSASLIGVEGLTLVTLLLAVLPACFVAAEKRRTAWILVALGMAVLAGAWGWGAARLAQAKEAFAPDVYLRLVQPGTDQSLKWQPERRLKNFRELLDLTFETPSERPITHYLWPETATAFYLGEEPDLRDEIARRLPSGARLLTGVVRRSPQENGGTLRYYNSLVALDGKGNVIGGYDKHHLVPFGEYMPFRSLIPIRALSALGVDFTAGEALRTMRAQGLPPFSPLICYEVLFSGQVVEKEDPPQFLLNVTNDAWYKGTIGPAQHYMISRVRAVETGLPLVRVANQGVTGVIDPYGRAIAVTGAEKAGFVDALLPKPIDGGTLFEKEEGTSSWLILSAVACFLFLAFKRKKIKKP